MLENSPEPLRNAGFRKFLLQNQQPGRLLILFIMDLSNSSQYSIQKKTMVSYQQRLILQYFAESLLYIRTKLKGECAFNYQVK
jgi:hypothetical protein